MPKKIIVNESTMKRLVSEEYIEKKDLKNLIKNDKDLEKRVRAIVADAVNDLFRTLWQRRNFYDSEIRNK